MTEKGKIREIKENAIIIAPDRSACCFGCMKMECKVNGGILYAVNPKALPLEIGQTVELKTHASPLWGQSVIALLPPTLCFILGFFLIRLLLPEAGEGAAAFSGVLFLFTSAFIIYKLRKRFPAKEFPRYVERVLY